MGEILETYHKLGLIANLEPIKVLPNLIQLLEYRKLLTREMINYKHVSTEKEFDDLLKYVNDQIKKLLVL